MLCGTLRNGEIEVDQIPNPHEDRPKGSASSEAAKEGDPSSSGSSAATASKSRIESEKEPKSSGTKAGARASAQAATKPPSTAKLAKSSAKHPGVKITDHNLIKRLDTYSIEDIVELKIARFLDQLGGFYPENMHELIMCKVEKPLIVQILRQVGGNQVHASKILGINRNTLRKKMKLYSIGV